MALRRERERECECESKECTESGCSESFPIAEHARETNNDKVASFVRLVFKSRRRVFSGIGVCVFCACVCVSVCVRAVCVCAVLFHSAFPRGAFF